MKSAIIYYSNTGNTRMVANVLKKYLGQKGEVDTIELKPLDESNTFLGQCARAFKHTKALLADVNYNVSKYDLICFGTPVWAFGPAPAVNTYLDNCQGASGKDVILFATYGSGTGKQRCLDYIRGLLAKKAAKSFKEFSVQQGKAKNEEFILNQIKETVSL